LNIASTVLSSYSLSEEAVAKLLLQHDGVELQLIWFGAREPEPSNEIRHTQNGYSAYEADSVW
jgi:hypothetical protein